MRDVLLLHCMLASGAAWRGVLAALPGIRGRAPDLPGHGRAPVPDGAYMDAALRVALDAMPDGPADVVGHSYGAVTALRLLVEHPERVRSLVLVEPVLFAANPEARAWTLERMAPFAAACARGDREAAAAHFHGLWGDGRWADLPEAAKGYIRDRIHLIDESADGLAEDAHGILPRLPSDAAPVLVTRRDPPLPVARIAEGLAARMPGTRRVAVGAGHMIPMTDAAALAAVLREAWAAADR